MNKLVITTAISLLLSIAVNSYGYLNARMLAELDEYYANLSKKSISPEMIQPGAVTPDKLDRVYLTNEAQLVSWLETNTYVQVEADPVAMANFVNYYTSSQVDDTLTNYYTIDESDTLFLTNEPAFNAFAGTNMSLYFSGTITNLISTNEINILSYTNGLLLSPIVTTNL
jgi:hypothetical protein